MSYRHFSKEERIELRGLLKTDLSQNAIATLLSRNPGALSRELQKGGGRLSYTMGQAQKQTTIRRVVANQQHRKLGQDVELTQVVVDLLGRDWSPEQIVGRMKLEHQPKLTSFSAIYGYVNCRPELAKLLPRKHSKYRKRHGITKREEKRQSLETKRNISTRPEIVEQRSRIGDWEGDTIIGQEKKERILTHTERMSGYLLALKTDHGEATEIKQVTSQQFRSIPHWKRQTITYDRGVEFANWELTEKQLKTMVYFANPYHSWERGTSENANGLVRRYFPKGTKFATLSQKELAKAIKRINHRPRKRLGYKTPHEIFNGIAVRMLI